MKRITLIGLGAIALLIIAGCTQPNFNPNRKNIVFFNGKPYYIPKNTHNLIKSMNTADVKEMNGYGVRCKKGDTLWLAHSANSLMTKGKRTPEKDKADFIRYIQGGLVGCSSPLSNQEYNYRLNEKQAKKRQQNKNMNNITNSINNVSRNNIEMMKAMNQPSVVYVY